MRMRAALLLVLVVGFLGACGDDDPIADTLPSAPASSAPATTAPATTAPGTTAPGTTTPVVTGTEPAPALDLDGREFLASEVEGYELVEGSQIRVNFEGANLGATGGCNRLVSTWSLDGDRLVVPDMAMTQMACERQALMEQDAWLATFLTSGPTVALEGDTLTLTGEDVTMTLVDREVAEPDRELEGTTWVLEGIISADAVSSVPAGTPVPTLQFEAGQLAIDTGCNTGGAAYEAAKGVLIIEPIRLTRMACVDPAGGELEAIVVAVLEATPSYEIDADLLTLTSGDNGLVYRAMDAGGPTGA